MKKILVISILTILFIVVILIYGFSYCSRLRNSPGNPLAGISYEEYQCMRGSYFKLGINLFGYEI